MEIVIGLVWLIFVFIAVKDFETRITSLLMIFMELLAITYAINIILEFNMMNFKPLVLANGDTFENGILGKQKIIINSEFIVSIEM